jgi:hypothetical protein
VCRSGADSSIKNKPCAYLEFRNDFSYSIVIDSWCQVFKCLFIAFYHHQSYDWAPSYRPTLSDIRKGYHRNIHHSPSVEPH